MAIKGSLKEASLPDVIQLLYLGRRTGCLAITDRQNLGYIYFDDGEDRVRLDREPARPAGRHAGPQRPHHGRAAAAGGRPAGERPRGRGWARSCSAWARSRGRNSTTTCASRSRRRCTTCSRGPPAPFNFEAGRAARSARLPGGDQPRVAAARGRAAGGRVEPDREEDPQLRPDLHRRPGRGSRRRARRCRSRSSRSCRCSTARATCSRWWTSRAWWSSLVGQALYGLITAGYAHRTGSSATTISPRVERRAGGGAPQPRRRLLQHRHAGRGAARVPPRGGTAAHRGQRTVLPRAHRARAGQAGRRRWRRSSWRWRRAGRGPPRCTTSRSPWSSSAGWTRPRRPTAMPRAARGTTTASCSAGRSRRCSGASTRWR